MIDVRRGWPAGAAVVLLTVAVAAEQSQQSGQPAAGQPAAQPPASAAASAPPVPGTVTCPAPTPPATLPARMFTAPAGMILIQVASTKVAEFEKFLGYVREALAKTTDATLRKQAMSWTFFRVAEPGPNNDVLYALLLDPAVPCVDYSFGPILAAANPDQARLVEIWALYTGSVKSGGTLMNFVPIDAIAAAPPAAPSPAAPGPADQTPPPLPLDANPIRPPR